MAAIAAVVETSHAADGRAVRPAERVVIFPVEKINQQRWVELKLDQHKRSKQSAKIHDESFFSRCN